MKTEAEIRDWLHNAETVLMAAERTNLPLESVVTIVAIRLALMAVLGENVQLAEILNINPVRFVMKHRDDVLSADLITEKEQ